MHIHLLQGWSGLSLGYSYSHMKDNENEVKQGKNYYSSVISQAVQLSLLSSLVLNVAKNHPNSCITPLFKNILRFSFFIALPCTLAIADLKHERCQLLLPKGKSL